MQKGQIDNRLIDVTWIFTQSLFMNVNTMLWTLSYSEIRRRHPRDEVESHLQAGLEAIKSASERWPGVESALSLYQILVEACLKIYDKEDGDIPISATSPSDGGTVSTPVMTEAFNRSRTTSPATVSTQSVSTPPEKPEKSAPFGYVNPSHFSVSPQVKSIAPTHMIGTSSMDMQNPLSIASSSGDMLSMQHNGGSGLSYDPNSQFNPLPATFDSLASWTPSFSLAPSQQHPAFSMPPLSSLDATNIPGNMTFQTTSGPLSSPNLFPTSPAAVQYSDYLYPQSSWAFDRSDMGLNMEQQMELMESLETSGQGEIMTMIEAGEAIWR